MDCAARLFHLFEGAGNPFADRGVKRRCRAAPHGAGGGGDFCVTGRGEVLASEDEVGRRAEDEGQPLDVLAGEEAKGQPPEVLFGQDEVSRRPEDEIRRPCRRGG